MTAREERLVLELHAKWGNRWSRIAHKLPGRTDNEIKNYWRTHMRKKAQEQKQTKSPSMTLSNSSISSDPTLDSSSPVDGAFYDLGGLIGDGSLIGSKQAEKIADKGYSMDDIWKYINMTNESPISHLYDAFSEGSNFYYPPPVSPVWDYCSDSFWKMGDEESKMFLPSVSQFPTYYDLIEAPSEGS